MYLYIRIIFKVVFYNLTIFGCNKKIKNKIFIFDTAIKAATGADVIFSDKVISMNDKVDKIQKLNHFKKNTNVIYFIIIIRIISFVL